MPDTAATMNTGWRTISRSGRPPPALSAAVGLGTSTRDWMASATIATAASNANDPRKGVANMSLPQRDIAGPRKPPTMPPASTSEMARALVAGEDTSAAAKRYCSPIALYTPITAVAAQ